MASVRIYPVDPRLMGRPLAVVDISEETPPVYPSSFWESNPGKPGVNIYLCGAPEAYYRLVRSLNQKKWSDPLVTTFLARVILENPEIFQIEVPAPWTPDGRDIARANAMITPLDVLHIDEIDTPPPAVVVGANGGTAASRRSLFFALVLLYRKVIAKSTNATCGTNLALRFNNFFQANQLNVAEADLTACNVFMREGYMTSSYKRIICAIDMFFFKFSTSPFASIRMATLPSRFRGCDALASLGQVSRMTGLAIKDLLSYVFTFHVAKDVRRISKVGQGAENVFGYFPYHLEMGMTTKSAYSMTVNPTLCLWLHIIGVITGYTRSCNARMPDATDVPTTVNTAAAVALSLGRPASLLHPIHERATEVLTQLMTNNGLSEAQQLALRNRATKCRTYPEGTVGAFFYQMFGGTDQD